MKQAYSDDPFVGTPTPTDESFDFKQWFEEYKAQVAEERLMALIMPKQQTTVPVGNTQHRAQRSAARLGDKCESISKG